MNSQEKLEFEDELKNSKELKNEFEEYKNLLKIINETKNTAINKEYSESIVPNFRNRLDKIGEKKSYKNLKYVLASFIIIIAGYFIVSQINREDKQDLNQVLTNLSDDELNLYAADFYSSEDLTKSMENISSKRIDSLYAENLKSSVDESIDNINPNLILNKNDVTDIYLYLSDNDIDRIYSQLIEKKIL
jgi:hypothetical protein